MELYKDLFNSQTLANMAIISAVVTAIRNVVKVDGAPAVVLTFLVSITYGVLQFGLSSEYGIVYGAIVGIATAFTFYLSKNVGAVLQILTSRQEIPHTTALASIHRQNALLDTLPSVWQLVKFIFFRKL